MEGTQYVTKEAVLRRAQEIKGIPLRDVDKTGRLATGKGAIGTIVRKGITVETTWLPQELCWLLTARNLQGHGILDPRKAVEIRDEAA